MRLVFFVKDLTGWSYQTAEWVVIGLIAGLIVLAFIVWAVRRHRRNKAQRAIQAPAAPKTVAENRRRKIH